MSVETLAPSASEHGAFRDAPGGAVGHEHHSGGPGANGGHAHHRHARPVRVGPSVLRMSLGARLLLAVTLLAPLWIAVALVVGGAG